MKLKDCKQGILVKDDDRVGMIIGVTNNCPSADQRTRGKTENAIPLVQWSCGDTHGIHPGNIEILK